MVSTPSWCNLLLKCVILPAIVEYQLVEATRQVFMSFVELQKLGTMFLKDITGGSHYLFEEIFTDDKQYPSAGVHDFTFFQDGSWIQRFGSFI